MSEPDAHNAKGKWKSKWRALFKPPALSDDRKAKWERVRHALLKPSVMSVALLVLLWNLSVESRILGRLSQKPGALWETLAEIRDLNLHIQLRFYQFLTSFRAIEMQPGQIRFVYINDVVHWTNLYGEMPTSREFLASLIRNASEPTTKALAIGLDVELLAPRGFHSGSDAAGLVDGDAKLLDALLYASSKGVPVVLPIAFYSQRVDGEIRNVRLPNVFKDSDLPLRKPNGSCPPQPPKSGKAANQPALAYPGCITFGYINAPNDKREIPTSEILYDSDTGETHPYDSFALALAKSVEGWPYPIEQYPTFANAQESNKAIFGGFLRETDFLAIDALSLSQADVEAMKGCAGKILLIGGNWHDLEGYGPQVDAHLSPAGLISGVAFHANYVDALLQRQFATEVPVWLGIVIDLLVGLLIYTAFEIAEGWQEFVVLAAAGFIPPLLAYLALVMTNYYWDFLLPIELYFLHILYEMIKKSWDNRRKRAATLPAV